jgi:hypothetical protein
MHVFRNSRTDHEICIVFSDLSIVEMAESSDESLLVHGVGHDFEAAVVAHHLGGVCAKVFIHERMRKKQNEW